MGLGLKKDEVGVRKRGGVRVWKMGVLGLGKVWG